MNGNGPIRLNEFWDPLRHAVRWMAAIVFMALTLHHSTLWVYPLLVTFTFTEAEWWQK